MTFRVRHEVATSPHSARRLFADILGTRIPQFIFVSMLLQGASLADGTGAPGDDIAALKPEQIALANSFTGFLERIDALHFERVRELNKGERVETKSMGTEFADYDIRVVRGPVIEKSGRTLTITKKPTREFEPPSHWSRYYLLDIHPATPLVGMLHAAIVVQFYDDGSSVIGGFIDVLETANREEDLAYLKQVMDEVYTKHGVDPSPHRRLSREGHDEDDPLSVDNSRRRKTAMVGGSFYGSPLMAVNEKNLAFMTEAYERMLDAYLTVVVRRKDDPFGAAEIAAQDAMRRNWLEDRFFSDPYTTAVTPYEAWALYSLPPEVKF